MLQAGTIRAILHSVHIIEYASDSDSISFLMSRPSYFLYKNVKL